MLRLARLLTLSAAGKHICWLVTMRPTFLFRLGYKANRADERLSLLYIVFFCQHLP